VNIRSNIEFLEIIFFRAVDPDSETFWTGSVLGIRIQGQENEEISVEKCTF
jgi:hypothetical protein